MPKTTASLRSIIGSVVIASSVLLAPSLASAGDKALAETLFQDGRKLLDAGKYDAACQKFEASQRQDPSPGTLINLGKCNEARGKTATAWANYKEAEALARNMSRSEQETAANEKAAALEPLLSRLEIRPPPTAIDGLSVKRGGVTMSVEALGTSSPIDPGDYEIEASAPGYKTWKGKVTVGKEKDSASIQIPDLEKSAEPAVAPVPVEPPAQDTEPKTEGGVRADTSKGAGSTKTIGYVLTGVGAVALLAGGYFGYAANKQASDAKDDPKLCPDKQCTPAGRDEIDSAKSKALISTIGVGVGVAALGAGIVLIVTAPSNKEQASKSRRFARVSPYADGRNAGLFFSGAF
jgi:hypothetical protein